jgi:hypothetical protein
MLAIASAPACLELNPSYVDDTPAGTTDGDTQAGSMGESAGSTESGASSSGEPVDCSPDAFDPNTFEEPADASAGISAARLEGVDDEDWYKTAMDPMMPAEMFARTPGVDLRVCYFAECEGGSSAVITKCAGDPAVAPNWIDGCCSTGSVGLEYDCGGPTSLTIHVRVDDGGDACPDYDLEIGFNALQ